MRYAKDSEHYPGIKDYYSIYSYTVNTQENISVVVKLLEIKVNSTGIPILSYYDYHIVNKIENIVDPDWDQDSDPPKPKGFDPLNPLTWGYLAWDDIPRIVNQELLYGTKVLEKSRSKTIEQAIIEVLIDIGHLPNDPGWKIIDE